MTDFRRWLAELGLENYADAFAEQRIDFDVLSDLTEADLIQMSVPLGDRKRMLRAIAALRREREAGAAGDGEAPPRPSRPTPPPDAGEPEIQFEQHRQMTLMFADLVGSTGLSQQLGMEEYRAVIRRFHDLCAGAVDAFGGFVAQYLGDGIFAYFGYPDAGEDDVERAAACGLQIVADVAQADFLTGGGLKARVGIATGQVLIGDLVGERISIREAVIGQTANLAARVQGQAEPGQVLINGTGRALLGNQFECESLGERSLKGFVQPVEVWRVGQVRTVDSRFEAHRRGALSPFVGRDLEMDLLRRNWRETKEGQGRIVLVSGEAGIGKSRLLREFCEQIEADPATIMRFQCLPRHESSALHPVIAHLEYAAGIEPADAPDDKLRKIEAMVDATGGDAAEIAPHLARLLSGPSHDAPPADAMPAALRKSLTLEALLAQMTGVARHGPAVVLVEDLHWIDPTSQELLDMLVDRITDLPLMLACTFRPEYLPHWIGRPNVRTINPRRLDDRHAAALVTRQPGAERLPAGVAEAILSRTDGVPLFLEELTRNAIESMARGGEAGAGPRTEHAPDLPATLRDSLMARIDRIPGAKTLAPIGAAIGRQFDYRLLAEVAGVDDARLRRVLDRLVQAELLLQRGNPPEARYRFGHALVQDVAYATMPRSRMRELHGRIAETLEAAFPDLARSEPEQIAHHYALALRPPKAMEFWRRAAENAIERSANIEAIAHIEAALEQNQLNESEEERDKGEIALREMLCVPLEARGWGSDDIDDNLERLRRLHEKTGGEEALFVVLHGLCGTSVIGGRIQRARELSESLARSAERLGDPAYRLLSNRAQAMAAFFSGDFDRAIDRFERVVSGAESCSQHIVRKYYVADVRLVSLSMLSWACLLSDRRERAEAAHAEALALTRGHEHAFSRTYGYGIAATWRQSAGDAGAALDFASEARRLARENGLPYWEAWAGIVEGWATAVQGDDAAGAASLIAGIEDYRRTGSRQIETYAKALLADLHLRAGRVHEGLAVIDALKAARPTNEVRFYDREIDRIERALLDAQTSAQHA